MSQLRFTVPASGVHRRRLSLLVAVLSALAALAAIVALAGRGSEVRGAVSSATDRLVARGGGGALGAKDGYVAPGASLSPRSRVPAVARLDPALREAVRRAAADARGFGLALRVNSGWRSARYQQELARRAVRQYGSPEAARQFVKPASQSRHVAGTAVDLGPSPVAAWLVEHGADHGLCRVYANEPWHFELATTPGGLCPELIADAAAG